MLLIEGHRAKHPQVGGAIPLGNLQNGRAKLVKPHADVWRIGACCGHGSILLWNGRSRGQLFCEEAKVTLRLLDRHCGPLSEVTSARIQALPVDQLEALAVGEAWLRAGGIEHKLLAVGISGAQPNQMNPHQSDYYSGLIRQGARDGAGLRRVAWPLPHGAPGELEVEGWRDRSAGREVSLG